MDEYISREAVVRYLKGFSEKELNGRSNFGMITSSVLDKAERAMSEMPAADVQPVKHGRWENGHCTHCGEDVASKLDTWPDVQNFIYCPNCGSKNEDGDSE